MSELMTDRDIDAADQRLLAVVTTPGAVQTEAGKRLLDDWLDVTDYKDARFPAVAAIEAEAVALFKQGLAERIDSEVAPLIVGTKYEVLAGNAVRWAVLSLITGDSNADREAGLDVGHPHDPEFCIDPAHDAEYAAMEGPE